MPNPARAARAPPTTAETSGGTQVLTVMSAVSQRTRPDEVGALTPRSPSHGHSAYTTTAATASRTTTTPTVAAAAATPPPRAGERAHHAAGGGARRRRPALPRRPAHPQPAERDQRDGGHAQDGD